MRTLTLALAGALLLGACSSPILANAPAPRPTPPATPAPAVAVADPLPVELPRDDGPHGRLTEWWYYTGHLRDTATGDRYGFEYVIFRAERGDFPVSWASHLAITDESRDRFLYAERTEIGPQVDQSPRDAAGTPTGFALALSGLNPTKPEAWDGSVWTMAGAGGRDVLRATASAAEAQRMGAAGPFGLELRLAERKPPVRHDRDGWIDFGPAGGSYYYSRTVMAATGALTVDGRSFEIEGSAWFDHQWGDFISVGGGGWDWFAMNLADGTDITLSLVRAADGTYPLVYGTLVDAAGRATHLEAADFTVTPTRDWTSPATGATYPAGWRISLPAERLEIELVPTVAAQELDTRGSTGVVYWEGSQRVTATRNGQPLAGRGVRRADGVRRGAVGAAGESGSPAGRQRPRPSAGTLAPMRLELTRRGDYGVRAMLALSRWEGPGPLSARRIAEGMAIPLRFVPQVMADLARAGLVEATAGRRGGYRIARPADQMSLLDVIEAIEGDSRRRTCVLRGGPCGRDGFCDVHDPFFAAQDQLLSTLAATTFASLPERLGGWIGSDEHRPGDEADGAE